MTKRTSVILDVQMVLLAQEKYKRIFHQDMNFSDFFRQCLEAWVYSGDDPRPIWQQTSDIVEQIKKEMATQKRLIQDAATLAEEREAVERDRADLVRQVTLAEVRAQNFRVQNLPDHDNGYFTSEGIRKKLVDEIAHRCQLDLQWKDVDQYVRMAVRV